MLLSSSSSESSDDGDVVECLVQAFIEAQQRLRSTIDDFLFAATATETAAAATMMTTSKKEINSAVSAALRLTTQRYFSRRFLNRPDAGFGRFGSTPLHWAAYKARPGALRALVAAGADIDAVSSGSLTSSLLWSVVALPGESEASRSCRQQLIDAGAASQLLWLDLELIYRRERILHLRALVQNTHFNS